MCTPEPFHVFYIPRDFPGTSQGLYICLSLYTSLLFFLLHLLASFLLVYTILPTHSVVSFFDHPIQFYPFLLHWEVLATLPGTFTFLAVASTCLIGAGASQGSALRGGYCHAPTSRLDT